MNSDALEISPTEANAALSTGATILDVREPQEFSISQLPNSQLVPMGTVPESLNRIENWSDSGPLLILCHHGVRSLQVTVWLREHGIENCWSVAGGIDQWSRQVNPDIPRY